MQLEELEIQVHPEQGNAQLAVIRLRGGAAVMMAGDKNQVSSAFQDVLEIGVAMRETVKGIRLSFWQDGLPIRSVPRAGSFGASHESYLRADVLQASAARAR